jgi:hypothetical protein
MIPFLMTSSGYHKFLPPSITLVELSGQKSPKHPVPSIPSKKNAHHRVAWKESHNLAAVETQVTRSKSWEGPIMSPRGLDPSVFAT